MPARHFNPRLRFALWCVIVVLALSASVWMRLAGGSSRAVASSLHSLMALGAMLWLLRTTPSDAIKIPGWLSALVVSLGTIWLSGVARGGWPAPPATMVLFLGLVTAALLAIEYPDLGRIREGDAPRRARVFSSWWAALVLWHPALWLAAPSAVMRDVGLILSLVMALGVTLIPTGFAPRVGLALWSSSWIILLIRLPALVSSRPW